jgi:hypothetical protein
MFTTNGLMPFIWRIARVSEAFYCRVLKMLAACRPSNYPSAALGEDCERAKKTTLTRWSVVWLSVFILNKGMNDEKRY